MASVHGLQHIKSLTSADFANDYTVGAHTQCVFHEIPLPDLALTLNIWWTGLQTRDVRLLKLEFGRVFYRNNTLTLVDKRRHCIQ